ncbi:GntR family transcriptional regulator [Herbiconiux sp. 11R-BC]|uniref:GntR family transcriptional regulator n=1 Tax=Herbiconiux sp. 11R-BC TaxID=3111637 RepID=UPI003C0625C1
MVHKAVDSFLPVLPGGAIPRGAGSDVVFDALVGALISGELGPGMTLHDASIAEHLGLSRTPVREAIQRLRVLGVVEASPSRHTRVVDVPPERTREALLTWAGLFQVLCEELVPLRDPATAEALARAHGAFLAARAAADDVGMAQANFAFYAAPLPRSQNAVLLDAIRRVVFIIRLGGLTLPARIDVDVVEQAQRDLVRAFEGGDVALAASACRSLRELEIPQNTPEQMPARG